MNMMKYCPECYKEIPPESPSCPFCGYKTGNGDEDETPQILETPKTDSYIPPEQTVLSLLLLLIFFWGINIALTVLPIFLNFGTTKNILIAAIVSQVSSRALVGIWAFAEVSLKKGSIYKQKDWRIFIDIHTHRSLILLPTGIKNNGSQGDLVRFNDL